MAHRRYLPKRFFSAYDFLLMRLLAPPYPIISTLIVQSIQGKHHRPSGHHHIMVGACHRLWSRAMADYRRGDQGTCPRARASVDPEQVDRKYNENSSEIDFKNHGIQATYAVAYLGSRKGGGQGGDNLSHPV